MRQFLTNIIHYEKVAFLYLPFWKNCLPGCVVCTYAQRPALYQWLALPKNGTGWERQILASLSQNTHLGKNQTNIHQSLWLKIKNQHSHVLFKSSETKTQLNSQILNPIWGLSEAKLILLQIKITTVTLCLNYKK